MTTSLSEHQLVYDWNRVDEEVPVHRTSPTFWDETLRDGIQSPSITDPPIDAKIRILHFLDKMGIQSADVGLPGAGARATEDVSRLVTEIVDGGLTVAPACAARTHLNDVRPIAEIAQRTGIAIEAATFIGSSPIRQYAEGWDLERMLRMSAETLDFCAKEGLPVVYVTEDTVRSRPETLRVLLRNAIDHGATRLCLCDTVGHATPQGTTNLVRFVRTLLRAWDADHIGIDWHGHNDRGLAVINNLAAWEAGADRIHGTILGVGERVGNASLDQTLVNLHLLGHINNDLTSMGACCKLVSQAYGVPISISYPVVGRDAFRTATGVHAAAIIKAQKKGDAWLADRIYSGIPAASFGREQVIEIGPMSGESNVVFWLSKRGFDPKPELVQSIFDVAKRSDHTLEDEEVHAIITRAEMVGMRTEG